jgi:hypothetical protein
MYYDGDYLRLVHYFTYRFSMTAARLSSNFVSAIQTEKLVSAHPRRLSRLSYTVASLAQR